MVCSFSSKAARQCKHCSDTAAIIIGAWRGKHGVVVCADQDDRRRRSGGGRSLGPENFRLEIVAGLAAYFVTVSTGTKAGAGEGDLNEMGPGVELWIMPHVSLPDFAGERLRIGTEL